jgi:hypothetical protein
VIGLVVFVLCCLVSIGDLSKDSNQFSAR